MPKFLRMVMDESLVPLPEAIRKMTSLPATHFNIRNRGTVAQGYKADIAIFDPDKLKDHASYAAPHALSSGITHVLVNGTQTLADSKATGNLPGTFV